MKKLFTMIIWILVVILVFVLGVIVFTKTAPQFGAELADDVKKRLEDSPNYDGKTFQNLVETKMDMGLSEVPALLWEYTQTKNTSPDGDIPTKWNEGVQGDTAVYATWYGHSAVLLEIGGKRILFDPMLGPASSPVPFLTKRFSYEEPIPLEKIDEIDAVIISHDHYDHLDYPSIIKLKDKVDHFFTGLAVGEHLQKWGVEAVKISELDWWQEMSFQGLEIISVPARHFSGRRFGDRNATQWASWIVRNKEHSIYFSGDSGYANHFSEIGKKYGPFDFAFVECGQYNEKWDNIHMFPEQTVQAGLDVGASQIMPIHWGAFNLSLHDWRDSINRALKASEGKEIVINHPYVGYRFNVIDPAPQPKWWEETL